MKPCHGKMKRRFKPPAISHHHVIQAVDICKCKVPVKLKPDYIIKDYIDPSTIEYEYSMSQMYGAVRAAFMEEKRKESMEKKTKVVIVDDEVKRKTSLEMEHINKIEMIKLKESQKKRTCDIDYNCRCQSKMLTPLSMNHLLEPRIGCKILELGGMSKLKKRFTIPKMTYVLTPAPRTGGIHPEKTKIFVANLREKLKIIQNEIPEILKEKEEKEDAEKQKSELFRLKNLKNYNPVRLPENPTSDDYIKKLLRRKIQVMGRCYHYWRERDKANKSKMEEPKMSDEEQAFAEKCKVIISNKKFKRTVQNYIRSLPKISSEENLRFFLKHYPKLRTLSEMVTKYPPPDQIDSDEDLKMKKTSEEEEEIEETSSDTEEQYYSL